MLLVQKFLEKHTFEALIAQHGVYPSFNRTGHLFSLNYDMIESREDDLLAQECRGLILSKYDGSPFIPNIENDKLSYKYICPGETIVLAFGMKRFFNYGQGSAANIDFNDPTISIMEKLDGTLCQVWHNPFTKQWNVATRSCPEADIPLDYAKYTFRTLFEKALMDTCNLSFKDFTDKLNEDITYCFELTTPYNRIIVDYKVSRVTLLAARHRADKKEFALSDLRFKHFYKLLISDEGFNDKPFDLYGVPFVKTFSFKGINEIVEWVSNQNPLEYEGVVVRDANFNRIKIKNASYIAFNKARDILGSSDRNCLELILLEKDDDIIAAMPQEIADNLAKIKINYKSWLIEQQNLYNKIFEEAYAILPNDKKTFVLTVKKNNIINSGAFFTIFDKKAHNMKDYVSINKKLGTYPDHFLDRILSQINVI